jgi:hypothetical protein
MTNANEPINPQNEFSYNMQYCSGLTKREYFAAMAMQGLMACEYKGTEKQFAKKSVGMADALINALNETK